MWQGFADLYILGWGIVADCAPRDFLGGWVLGLVRHSGDVALKNRHLAGPGGH